MKLSLLLIIFEGIAYYNKSSPNQAPPSLSRLDAFAAYIRGKSVNLARYEQSSSTEM
jgi:hypothetical protein